MRKRLTVRRGLSGRSWCAHLGPWERTAYAGLELRWLSLRGATESDRRLAAWAMRRADRMWQRERMPVQVAAWRLLAAIKSKPGRVPETRVVAVRRRAARR